jgi:nitrous oxidase accessory protein NosD
VAINAVSAGGEVVALDSAGFGSNVTINKSVSLIAPPGVFAGVGVLSGDGITVNASTNDVVTLRGLTVNSEGTFNSGIVFTTGGSLHIENCAINGFTSGAGIFQSGAGHLAVKDSVVKNNHIGVDLDIASGTGFAAMDNVTISDSSFAGLSLVGFRSGQITAHIVHSSISDGLEDGVLVVGNGGTASLHIEDTVIANNVDIGLDAAGFSGGTGSATISNCLIRRNAEHGVVVQAGGSIFSRGNNTISENGSNTGSLTPLPAQ